MSGAVQLSTSSEVDTCFVCVSLLDKVSLTGAERTMEGVAGNEDTLRPPRKRVLVTFVRPLPFDLSLAVELHHGKNESYYK